TSGQEGCRGARRPAPGCGRRIWSRRQPCAGTDRGGRNRGGLSMFKGLGQLAGLLQNLPRIKAEMENMQQRLAALTAEGDAGGGMVKVRVNGRFEVLSCALSDDALCSGDREMLEDLIRAATNQAMDRARQLAAEETGKIASNLGLPPGMALPGMTQ